MFDITIIGAGIIGCSIARELSRLNLKILLIEKENDVSCGASKANSGIVHGGYDAKAGTNKAYFSRKGNLMYDKLDEELNFGFERCGSLVLAFTKEECDELEKLMENGVKNNVLDLKLIDKEEILKLEPHVNKDVIQAIYCPSAGITSPYEATIAFAENAILNGVELKLKNEVKKIEKQDDVFLIYSKERDKENIFKSKYIINCAGAYSDKIANMVGLDDFYIIPRRGEYILLNKNQGNLANRVLFQAPTKEGKGILVTKTVHGNLMLGPNAQEVQDPKEVGTNLENLKYIVKKARKTVSDFDLKYTLRSFSGIRATSNLHDFIIGKTKVKNFINVAGIESPGLTSSPAIARHIYELILELEPNISFKKDFNPYRKAIIIKKNENFDGKIDHEDKAKNIICRCEKVTESEIIDAINRGIKIDSLDAIKRRTRTMMGQCQGHFCTNRVKKILARELNIDENEITLRGKGSSSLPNREDRMFYKKLEE
ncbi:NAD(P)/FAD-dependent oxidoreductase [Peptostreptococcaceae bacterium AGR-M142]